MRPAALAGLVLVAVAASTLVLGRLAFAANPVQFEDAVLAVGLAVLAGAGLATGLAPSRTAAFVPAPTVVPAVTARAERAVTPPTAAPISPVATSIPASYVAAMYAPPPEADPASEYAGPIAAALPFAAFPRPTGPRDDGSLPEHAPSLDVELARLRARILELEADRDLDASPPWFAARSGGSRDLSPLAGSPRGPVRPIAGGPARCVGCGSAVAAQAPDPLCGNCGRPLCTACGGVPGPTLGLRRCPECAAAAARHGGVAISGGRTPPGSGPMGPSSSR